MGLTLRDIDVALEGCSLMNETEKDPADITDEEMDAQLDNLEYVKGPEGRRIRVQCDIQKVRVPRPTKLVEL